MEQPVKKDPEFLTYVFKLNNGRTLSEAFQFSLESIDQLDIAALNRVGLQTYAPGKWTIHQIFQHLIDWERIWSYRAVIFARKEGTIPDGHNQNVMSDHAYADERSIEDLIDELRITRQSTIKQFTSFRPNVLDISCKFFQYEMPLSSLAFCVTSHQIHHFNFIKEHYLPLAEK